MIKRICLTAVLLVVLIGCTPADTSMPPYFVMLTKDSPEVENRCSGALLNPWLILTADHCKSHVLLTRAVTQYGEEVAIFPYRSWPEIDIGLYRAVVPLYAPHYATLATGDTLKPATIYGACPFYFSHVPRPVQYLRDELFGVLEPLKPCQMWQTIGQPVCGGDSGGIVVQDGNLIGVPVAVEADIFWIPIGTNVCVVPAPLIAERLR